MANKPLKDQEIIDLLNKLKEETPDYPTELRETRKSGFLRQAVELRDSGSDKSGRGGSGGGDIGQIGWSARGALGGGTASTGLSTKSALMIGFVVVLLTLTYIFRNQIVDYLEENDIITVAETATPTLVSVDAQPTETPTVLIPFDGEAPTTPDAPDSGGSSSGTAGAPDSSGSGESGQDGIPVTSGDSESNQATPTQTVVPRPATPTPRSPDNSITGRLRFIVCILRGGGESCQ
jgi:hypothetical protein